MHAANTATVGARDAPVLGAHLVPGCNALHVLGASVRGQWGIAPTVSLDVLANDYRDGANVREVSTIGRILTVPGSVAIRGKPVRNARKPSREAGANRRWRGER